MQCKYDELNTTKKNKKKRIVQQAHISHTVLSTVRSHSCCRCCYSAPDREAEYCDKRVCLSVCLFVRDHICGTVRPIFTNFCACYLWPWLGPPLAA